MRDPERITRVLAKLEQIWKKCPDMRLGQLVISLNPNTAVHPFYVEDETIESVLDRKLKEETKQ